MTATAEVQQPQGAAPDQGPDLPCDVRLATWIPGPVDERLRLFAALQRRKINRVLAEVLSTALPTREELARLVGQKGASGDDAH